MLKNDYKPLDRFSKFKISAYALAAVLFLLLIHPSLAADPQAPQQGQSATQSARQRKAIYFDLDGVVLYHVPIDSKGERIIRVETDINQSGDEAANSETYRVANGFGELVESLVNRGWGVGIFSFGSKMRNESAAESIKLPNGKSFKQVIQETGELILSNADGMNLDPNDPRTSIDTNVPKALRPKIVKSLVKALGKERAANAYLVEDILRNSAPGIDKRGSRVIGQRETNTIYLPYTWVLDRMGREVEILEQPDGFEGAIERNDLATLRRASDRFFRLHNKMAFLGGLIETIEEKIAANPEITFSEQLQEFQWAKRPTGEFLLDEQGDRQLKTEFLDDVDILRKGTELLETVPGSTFQLTLPFNASFLCGKLSAAFDAMMIRSLQR